ncbi:lactate utilization protein [Frisingicoccus sp.]|uniref:lactate utilization protein n=1 Tax=Frisingicoccus sp. TaxID=1918627 RepID=UPI0026132BF2|nr:lactate utilization protein [Frisingicoccus sp.]MDD6232480.1 lactate utilization protein [Frisingicoccus sp.]MDY4922856.1 lactate utilization protein [Frisingicoccus sp.]
MNPKKKFYETAAETLIKNLDKRGMEAYYVDNKDDALKMALRFVTPGSSVSWGGSMSINEIGLIPALKAWDCTVLDRTVPKTEEEKKEFFGKVAVCDYYFMSTNAITMDGELVNIDGTGNRVASLIFGPSNVVIIAGMNKVADNLESAVDRARNTAAPMNTIRLDRKTPCTQVGRCMDCMSPDCICNQFVVTRRSTPAGRIKIILVGEELGY